MTKHVNNLASKKKSGEFLITVMLEKDIMEVQMKRLWKKKFTKMVQL